MKLIAIALLSLQAAGCGAIVESNKPTSAKSLVAPEVDSGGYMTFGAGNVATSYNPEGLGCRLDVVYWVVNGGVTLPAASACSADGKIVGSPRSRQPYVTGAAATKPLSTHRWWGSVPFFGGMQANTPDTDYISADNSASGASYITPDPVIARINNRGVRVMNLPAGLQATDENNFQYANPKLVAEVFDGVAIGNSEHKELNAYLKNSSDASVTVEWQSKGKAVMEATFVHGSPYVFFKSYQGQLVLKTLKADGKEKGTFYQDDNKLGVWTSVSNGRQDFLLVGDDDTQFSNIKSSEITISNKSNELTLVLLPQNQGKAPLMETISAFASLARNVVAQVDVTYRVNEQNNEVTVTHSYLGQNREPLETLTGLQPLHWKNLVTKAGQSPSFYTPYSVRSARGVTKFAQTKSFSYSLPFIGVLPSLPSAMGDYDMPRLQGYVTEFMAQDKSQWNPATDTYWSGKHYSKVAELAAIARSIGMTTEANEMIDWLKLEMENWFTAKSSNSLKKEKYFVYDNEWNTLLGVRESFGSHRMLNDHHFHYGYFVRTAAEVCRVDVSWCSAEQFGPMVELLIRDFAAGRDDSLFPYLRHFDPANGFSWASGSMPYSRGNNNESTSEAANAYGAMVLYGLIVDQPELVAKGIYLHASTSATYWQYWNDIDGYQGVSEEESNFPSDYDRITTSIIWGDGALFDTWFSKRFAHILGIQGLPANPLIVHVAQYQDYMADYVSLGLSESSNGKPSGLASGQWKDIWWSLWAMTDADAAIADYNSVKSYAPEEGETKAHTYHWLHTWKNLGQLMSGTGSITADHPATMVFEKDKQMIYVAYNFSDSAKTVTFSDSTELSVAPNSFATKIVAKQVQSTSAN